MNATVWDGVLALPVSPARDHIRGFAAAPLTLVEYGDYECPHCRAAHSVVNAIETHMGNQLRFAFRHFPLTTVHPHAQQAAEAAEAAGAQHKFWAMHDTLYANDARLGETLFIASARALGLNLDSFRTELARHAHVPRIREDFMSGVRSGVNGTPAFFINGIRHDGSWDFATLLAALNRGLSRSAHLDTM